MLMMIGAYVTESTLNLGVRHIKPKEKNIKVCL